MRVREDQSGGVGTDNKDEDDQDERGEIEDEGNGQENVDKADREACKAVLGKAERESLKHKKDAIHTWSFCKGRAPLIIWNDILQTFGGVDNGPVGDNVIADTSSGSVSSVPGGAGVKSTTYSGSGNGNESGGSGAGGGFEEPKGYGSRRGQEGRLRKRGFPDGEMAGINRRRRKIG